MKPHRLALTHNLILHYGLYKQMEVWIGISTRNNSIRCTDPTARVHLIWLRFMHQIISTFFSGCFACLIINFQSYSRKPEKVHWLSFPVQRWRRLVLSIVSQFSSPCSPVFDGLFDFCSIYTGGSLAGAAKLNHKVIKEMAPLTLDMWYCCQLVRWSSSCKEAGGFWLLLHQRHCHCHLGAAQVLNWCHPRITLRYHPRVLYIDIDVHHGDGVEEVSHSHNSGSPFRHFTLRTVLWLFLFTNTETNSSRAQVCCAASLMGRRHVRDWGGQRKVLLGERPSPRWHRRRGFARASCFFRFIFEKLIFPCSDFDFRSLLAFYSCIVLTRRISVAL